MRKLITLGIIATLALGLTGCDLLNPAETEPIEPAVIEEIEKPVVETKIVDTTDYAYDREDGALSLIETDKVLYVNEDNDNTNLSILGLDGKKLIVYKIAIDNSPGPGFIHEVWLADYVAKDIYYLDLADTEKGLLPYTVPEYKIELERTLLDRFMVGEVLLYSTEGVDVKVTTSNSAFDLTAETLESMADECGTQYEEDHFTNLVEAYENTPKYTYEFKYDGESQEPDTYTVTVLINRMEYTTLDDVSQDFEQCFAGGDMYPIGFAYDHIIFASGCGTGFADGSDLPIGCAEIKEVVEPTLEINPDVAFI
ncbi:hypothetical protein ACFL3T_03515 [Patescibacteria group bacterium]